MVPVTLRTVYPSANDIADVEKEGRYGTEQSHAAYVGGYIENHVVSGFTVPGSDADLVIPVALGVAFIDGHRVTVPAENDVTLADDDTNHVFLQLGVDGAGDVDTVDLVVNQTGSAPVRSVRLFTALTAAGVTTSTQDVRSFSPVKNGTLTGVSMNLLNNAILQAGTFAVGAALATITGITYVIPAFSMARQASPHLIIMASGDVVGPDVAGQVRTITIRARLNATVIRDHFFLLRVDDDRQSFAMIAPIGEAPLVDFDPTVANTIDIQASRSGGGAPTITLANLMLTVLEVGQTQRF